MNIEPRLQRFLSAEFTREAGSGFARLSRVPDTHVRHFLDYYRGLEPLDQSALAAASTTWGRHTFVGSTIDGHQIDSRDVRSIMQSNRAWVAWMNEMTNQRDRDPHWYTSVPLLRDYRALATMRRKRGEAPPTSWDRMMEEYALSTHGAKVPRLRSLMRTMFTERFHGRAVKGVGGNWTYEGEVSDGRVQLSVDWGSQYAQLRYGVTVFTRSGTLHLMRGFEGALGAGHGQWDFLTEENAEDSIALLGDLIEMHRSSHGKSARQWCSDEQRKRQRDDHDGVPGHGLRERGAGRHVDRYEGERSETDDRAADQVAEAQPRDRDCKLGPIDHFGPQRESHDDR